MRPALALLAPALVLCCSPKVYEHTIEISAYETEQLQCVNVAKTLAESQACRADVKARYLKMWNLDGGSDVGRD